MAMRLKLELDSFDVKYKDGEREGEWILIPWEKDLRNYLQLCSSLVNPVIRLLVVDPMGLKQLATFKESGMDPENNGIISDLLRFVSKKEIYNKAGKAWTRFYLLYEPPGADRSSLIAAMANYLEFDICDLDLTSMSSIPELENILFSTPNRSLITIQDFHYCAGMLPNLKNELTVSCLLKYVDGLFSRCGDERIVVFTTNHRDRYDAALLALVNLVFYNPTSPPQPIALPDGGETVQLGSLAQKPLVDFDAIDNREYQSGILVPNSKNNNMREASKRRRMTESVLSLVDSTTGISSRDFDPPNNGAYLVRACQSLPIMFNSEKKDTTEGFNGDFLTRRKLKREYRFISTIFDNHQQHFVERCEGAAKSFGVTHNCRKHGNSRVSTVKQIDKQHWIHRWPFRQKWATRKGYSLRDERPFEASSLSMDEELDSRFLFIHMSHFARPSPQPLALPDGGEIVGHTALSSSEFAASNNRAHLVRQDQSGSTTSRYEGKSARKTLDRQGITMSLCTAEDLQQHLGCKHKDAVKRLGVKLSMFKRTYRLHQVYCWPCRNKNNDLLAWKPFKERQELWLNMPDSLTQKSFKVVDVLPLLEQSNSIRHLVLQKRLALERWNCSGGLTPQSASLWPVGLPDGGHIVPVSKKKNVTISFKRECRTRSATFEDQHRHFGSRYKGVANNLGAKHMCKQHGINLVFTLKLIRRQHGIHRCPFRRGFSFGGERPAEVISLMEVKLVSRLQFLRISWLVRSSLRPLASSRGSEIERHIAFSSSEFADTNNRAHPGRKGQRGSNSSGSHPERGRTGETPYWEGIASHGIRFEHLQQRFGSKREDAARSLGISISTFKRVCRRNGIHRWPNQTKKRVLRPPDPHGENNPSPTYMTLSTIRQITVQNEMGGQNPEPNEFQLDAFVDLSLFNTERGSISDIPSDFDWTQFLANEELPFIEGNVSGSLNSTVAACSDLAPSQQPIPTCFDPALSQQPMPTCSDPAPSQQPLPEPMPTCFDPALSQQPMPTCSDPAPSQQPLPEPMPTCFDPALSQQPMPACSDPAPSQQPMPTCFDPAPGQQPRPTCSDPALSQQPMPQPIPTCFDPAPSQQPMPTCFDPALSQQPMPTFPHMMSDLAAREDTRSVVLKITYRKKILRFKFPLMSGINELKEEVKKRLKLELDSFDVEYEDEDGDSILLNCDEDLRNHLQLSSNPVIRLLVIDSDANTTDFS